MITITGRTFDHRRELQRIGARWDNIGQAWRLEHASAADLAALRAMVGIVVSDAPRPPQRPAPRHDAPTVIVGDDDQFLGRFVGDNPSAFFGFSSMAALADHVATISPDVPVAKPSTAWATSEFVAKWTGTPHMAEALRLARHGWTDGLGITDILTVDGAKSRRRRYDVIGANVNVGRMLAGDPKCMIRRTPQPGAKMIRLFVDCSLWKGIGATLAMMRVFLVAGMIDLLEREGYRCQVVACDSSRHFSIRRHKMQATVIVKDYHERLNLLDISFALGHPSFCRRLIFALNASVPACYVDEDDHCILSDLFDDDHPLERNEFYIPSIMPDDVSRITNDPLSILPIIEPDGLPIKLTGVR